MTSWPSRPRPLLRDGPRARSARPARCRRTKPQPRTDRPDRRSPAEVVRKAPARLRSKSCPCRSSARAGQRRDRRREAPPRQQAEPDPCFTLDEDAPRGQASQPARPFVTPLTPRSGDGVVAEGGSECAAWQGGIRRRGTGRHVEVRIELRGRPGSLWASCKASADRCPRNRSDLRARAATLGACPPLPFGPGRTCSPSPRARRTGRRLAQK